MPKVFLSHSSADRSAAEQLAETLEQRGISVFIDVNTLVSGTDFSEEASDLILHSDAVILLLSINSQRSKWVERELTHALESNKLVVPVLLDAEAKENWIWPLVADRSAVRVDNETGFEQIADSLCKAIGHDAHEEVQSPPPSGSFESAAPNAYKNWPLLVVVAILALVAGIVSTLIILKLF